MNIWSPALRSTPKEGSRELTIDEWVALPEDDEGELVEGRLVEEEVADPIHGLSVSWFTNIPRCDGLVLDLDALWAELERLAPEGE